MPLNSTAALSDSPQQTDPAAYAIVAPPDHLEPFRPRFGEGPATWPEYATHPAYASHRTACSVAERISSLSIFTRYFALILCKRLISYELIPAHLRRPKSLRQFWGLACNAAGNALQKLLPRARQYRAGPGETIARALANDGIAVIKLERSAFHAIELSLQPLIESLRRARGTNPDGGRDFIESRGAALRPENADLFAAVENMLGHGGILDACSSYLGHAANLIDVNPQINDNTDDFWRRIFPDLPKEEWPTSYLHRDASGGDIKAILYVSEVGPANGPFCYAIGSHRLQGSCWSDWVEEANDQSGFSSTKLEYRRRFAALPKILQRKCAFGNDIRSGTEIARRLVASEWTIEAPAGHLVLFDTKGFHRGGMVRDGERIVLTCVIGSARL